MHFDGACFAYDMDDGRGNQPYCESCFKESFMPTCAGCHDYILLGSQDAINACGQIWHKEHFRCAASGQLITDEYYEHHGLPYSPAKYFELFGHRCVHCDGAIMEDIIETLGQAWHPEHFMCASSGQLLPTDENGSYQFYERDLKPYSRDEYARLFCEDCTRCGLKVIDEKIVYNDLHFHPHCFTCEQCKTPLNDRSRFAGPTGLPFCDMCFTEQYGHICVACEFAIDVNEVCGKFLEKASH